MGHGSCALGCSGLYCNGTHARPVIMANGVVVALFIWVDHGSCALGYHWSTFINGLCKFRMEYGKPGGVKLSVTFDALNRISGKHRALFSSFLGDMVREHIGLQILSWKKRYFDVDLTVRKLVMNRLGQLLRNFRRKLRQTYILPNQDTPSKLNEVPAKYSAILKAEDWVNFVNYMATEEYKVKSAKAKMARSKCVFPHTMGRGGYAHVKEKMISEINVTEDKDQEGPWQVTSTDPRHSDRNLLLESQLDAADENVKEELLIKSMSSKMSQTEGMVTKLKNQLAAQGGQLQSTPTQLTPLDDAKQLFLDVIRMIEHSKNAKKVKKLLILMELRERLDQSERILQVKIHNPKKMCRYYHKLWHLKKTTIIAEGTVYKSDGKIMLHNKALPKDCYKVSIDKSLVDAAFIPDVGKKRLHNSFGYSRVVCVGMAKESSCFLSRGNTPVPTNDHCENKTALNNNEAQKLLCAPRPRCKEIDEVGEVSIIWNPMCDCSHAGIQTHESGILAQ
ncbi:hypothetical protein Tco_0528005 [Tanacetum coccineum]